MCILYINFCAISFRKTQYLHFLKNYEKNYDNSTPKQDMLAKIIWMSSFKIGILHAKFGTTLCNRIRDRTNNRIFGKNEIRSASYWTICTQIASLLYLMIYILCIHFCVISSTTPREMNWLKQQSVFCCCKQKF